MNFENLQKDLFERKLKLEEYFSKTFKLLKVFLKENKLWFILLTAGNTWIFFSSILQQQIAIDIRIAENVGNNREILGGLFLNLLIIFSIFIVLLVLDLLRVIIYTKAGYRIEGREKEYRFENAFVKYLKYIGLYLIFVVAIMIIVMALVLLTIILAIATREIDSVFVEYIIIAIPPITYVAIILLFVLNILYFFQIFYIRNMKVWNSFKYNLELSKKNRLRIIVPVIIIALVNLVFILPFSFQIFNFLPSLITFLISIICGFFSGIFGIADILMKVIVFLNVEYDYLKKQDEKKNENSSDNLELEL